MFNALRQNSELYMLDKSGTPSLKIGRVLMIKPSQPFYTNPLDSTVEITTNVDGETVEFKQVPANLSVATLGNVVIAENSELMCHEVESLIRLSKQIIESVPYHNEVVASCDEMLKRLNPQLAKEKVQEEKIVALEEKVSGMETTLTDIKTMLSQALNK